MCGGGPEFTSEQTCWVSADATSLLKIFLPMSCRSWAEPGTSGQRWGRHPLPCPSLELPDGVWFWAEGCVSWSSVHSDWGVHCGGGRGHGEHEPGRLWRFKRGYEVRNNKHIKVYAIVVISILLCPFRLLTQCKWEQEWRWAMPPCRTLWWLMVWQMPSMVTTWASQVWHLSTAA